MAAHVIAEFRLRDGKIVSCDELTHLLSGGERDRDLGSSDRVTNFLGPSESKIDTIRGALFMFT